MEVIHDWPDAEAAAILRAVRRAASPGAMVLIIESIVSEECADPRVYTLDVLMPYDRQQEEDHHGRT